MLDLDEALDSELVRAREMVVELDQPGAARPVRQLGVPVKCRRTPGAIRRPGPVLGEHTDEVLRDAGYSRRGDRGAEGVRRGRRPGERGPGVVHGGCTRRLLKMTELAERSGVSAGTIKHYLREGLLPEPVRTSRNMAYYPPEFVDRIRLIKRLQEERFMPLRLIKGVMDEDPERAEALMELEDRILERAVTARSEDRRVSAAEVRKRYDIPPTCSTVWGSWACCRPPPGATTPTTSRSSRPSAASARGATTSRSASPSTTRCATARRSRRWSRRRCACCSNACVGEVDVDRAAEIIAAGAEPLRELIGAMHSKLLLAELRDQRELRRKRGAA